MEIEFVKVNPTQNMTILVTGAVDSAAYGEVASALMAYEGVCAEQVGYVERAALPGAWARLQMAGGEFCGNATMSLAAYLAWKKGLQCTEPREIQLESSGVGPVSCAVKADGAAFLCTLRLSGAERVEERAFQLDGKGYRLAAILMPGVTHILLPRGIAGKEPRAFAEHAAAAWAGEIETDAFGILLYDESSCSIEPFVTVKTSATRVWERGCGSGSAAVGIYRAHLAGRPTRSCVVQPGGAIEVDAGFGDSGADGVSITGRVRIVARGVFFYEAPPL